MADKPTLAATLNAHLENGGAVQVTTQTRSTVYTPKHAGWFTMVGENLHVRHGKGTVCLSIGERVLVGIRLGRPAN